MTAAAVSAPVFPKVQVFTEFPSSNFTGLVPATITGVLTLQNGTIAAAFKLLNSITLASEKTSMKVITETSEILAGITYDRGVIKAICIHSGWGRILDQRKATEVVLSPGSSEDFELVKEEIDLQRMSDESYKKMVWAFSPLIKV